MAKDFPAPGDGERRPLFDSVVEMFAHAVETRLDAPAITCDERTFSYGDYGRCVSGLAKILEKWSVKGQRVSIVMPNSPEMAVAIFAVLASGAQATLFNPNYPEPELAPILRDCDPIAILTMGEKASLLKRIAADIHIQHIFVFDDDGRDRVESWRTDRSLGLPQIPIEPNDLATLVYTGGTTGISKGVNRTHAELMLTVRGMEASWPTRVDDETWLSVAPMYHTWGFLMGCICPVYGRAHLIMQRRYKPEHVVDALVRHKVTVFGGGPAAIYSGLLAATNFADADLSNLRVCPAGGSPVPERTLTEWERRTGVRIYEAFGMTEVSPITVNRPDGLRKTGSVGKAAPLVDIEIVDLATGSRVLPPRQSGEIRVRGPNAFRSYRNRPDETAKTIRDDWVYTGDIGYLDEDGYLFIVDRKKDMIIVGGFNVFPREIDEVLHRHPDLRESATIGIPDERKGEVPISYVVPIEGKNPNIDSILAFCRDRLVDYKVPRSIRIVTALPKTQANKLDRNILRAMAARERNHA